MGYDCISRDVILEASEQFNVPETKLVRAIHDAPSFFDRFTYGKEKYMAYNRAALLRHVQKDNVVYHGLAGHFLLQGIPHVLKVRIIADLDNRIREEMRRENISAEEARQVLVKDDEERRKWSLALYKIDTWDPTLYDMVLHIKTITVEDAVDLIRATLEKPAFQTTSEARRILDDMALGAQVEAALIDSYPTVKAHARSGVVNIFVYSAADTKTRRTILARASDVPGVRSVNVHQNPIAEDICIFR
jgi:hypothetical protein